MGRLKLKSGTYEGEWKNGKPHGLGRLDTPTYSYYGEFEDGEPHGMGVHKTWKPAEDVLAGEFRKGKPTRVFRRWSKGARYAGRVRETRVAEGPGIQLWNKGHVFAGDFEEGRSIEGFYRWPNQAVYIGGFAQSKVHGVGMYFWASTAGDFDSPAVDAASDPTQDYLQFYVGMFLEGNKAERGMFHWRTGAFYLGEWKNDAINGRGIRFDESGARQAGQWVKGTFQGK